MTTPSPPIIRTTTTRTTSTTRVTQRRVKVNRGESVSAPTWFRYAIILVPLCFISICMVLCDVTTKIHEAYVKPYLNTAIAWREGQNQNDWTYDLFACRSLTAYDAETLRLKHTNSVEDNVDHMLYHGGAIIPNVLDEQIALYVREYILWRNERISITENIPVIGVKNRWSLGLSVEETPKLAEVLKAIANNKMLQDILERLLGPNPALVELSTITAAVGANEQYWHHDLNFGQSASIFGRSFFHLYTLLIPLQDTVTSMGSTWIAPGTHYCYNTDQPQGFPVAGNSIWKAGDGLLYSSLLKHRGGSHEYGPERTVLIVTFTSRPDFSFMESFTKFSRYLPFGPVYGIRYDHWGFCWEDMKDPGNFMVAPMLRSYGLFKQNNQSWGWTFIRSTLYRMMNNQGGFMLMDLEAFVKAKIGIFKYIPKFLHGPVGDFDLDGDIYAPWPRYLAGTVHKIRDFLINVHFTLVTFLLSLILIWSLRATTITTTNETGHDKSTLLSERHHIAIFTFLFISLSLLLYGIGELSIYKLSRSPIAQLVANNSIPTCYNTLNNSDVSNGTNSFYMQSIAAANFNDVLISDILQVPQTHANGRWIDYHRANTKWTFAAMKYSNLWWSYVGLPPLFQQTITLMLLDEVLGDSNQVLRLNEYGDWMALSRLETVQFAELSFLRLWSRPFVNVRYGGISWQGPCANRDLQTLCKHLMTTKLVLQNITIKSKERKNWMIDSNNNKSGSSSSNGNHTKSMSIKRNKFFKHANLNFIDKEQQQLGGKMDHAKTLKFSPNTSFQVGDPVEARFDRDKSRRWYSGIIRRMDMKGNTFAIMFDNEFYDASMPAKYIRMARIKENYSFPNSTCWKIKISSSKKVR